MIGLHDVGVDEVGHQSCFTDEILLEFGNGGIFLANEFNRHGLVEITGSLLHRLINKAHPAIGNFAHHLVGDFDV